MQPASPTANGRPSVARAEARANCDEQLERKGQALPSFVLSEHSSGATRWPRTDLCYSASPKGSAEGCVPRTERGLEWGIRLPTLRTMAPHFQFILALLAVLVGPCTTSTLIKPNDPNFVDAQRTLARTSANLSALDPSDAEPVLFLQSQPCSDATRSLGITIDRCS